ncbi:uncharacterized protein EV422DRAFT_572400 [Fimicolochytrium jonesii]|uniref:uncharacterized protein n=1 Tax=Fimicolochytrium jonesii TaxID=1396493 RepID=UPI0022FF14D4|nr:uncharacterized protein EV422DRAFT_572400 [Fimicolochytrium jonesii]KAI8815809.1 hypothetical protein EV422DRAFT_572400 [Fimicolochytrium jonesii]
MADTTGIRQRPAAAAKASALASSTTTKPVVPVPPRVPLGPRISGAVIAKLVIFSFLLFFLPLATYFGTLNRLYNGNQNYSAISAVIVANLVVFAYVVVAFLEDHGDQEADAAMAKKVDILNEESTAEKIAAERAAVGKRAAEKADKGKGEGGKAE